MLAEYTVFDSMYVTQTIFHLASTIYISTVNKADHSWLEAGFLDRASSVRINYGQFDSKSTEQVSSTDGHNISVGGIYASKNHPVLVDVNYKNQKSIVSLSQNSQSTGLEFTSKKLAYSISVGSYIGTQTALMAEFANVQNLSDFENITRKSKTYGFSVRSLLKMFNNQAISLSGGLGVKANYQNDKHTYYYFTPIYYFNQRLSLEFQFSHSINETTNYLENQGGIGIHGFIGSYFSLGASYSSAIFTNSRGEGNASLSLTATAWY